MMFKLIPETILIERSIIQRMETSGAILQYLPQLLQTLFRTKDTASSLELFEADFKRQEKMQKQEMAKSKEWIAEKIGKLKTSPFAKHPLVEHSIARVEQSLNSQDQLPVAIHLHSIIANLQIAVSAVAAFGKDPLFEGWVEIGIARNNLKGCCYFEKFIFPFSVDAVFSLSKDLRGWREKRNTDPATLLNFLKILSRYDACKKTLPEPSFLRTKTASEAEKLCIQGEIRPYLRQFSSINTEDHPLSRIQLLNLIDTFLNMIEISITKINAKRKEARQSIQTAGPSADLRVRDKELAVNWMEKEWAKDNQLSQDTIVDRFILALIQNRIELEKDYQKSTFETWVDDADPLPRAERVFRPKTKNRKNG